MSNPTIQPERANPAAVRVWENQIGTGCAVLFLLPIAAAGAFTALRAVQLAQLRSWREALLNTLFAPSWEWDSVAWWASASPLGRSEMKSR